MPIMALWRRAEEPDGGTEKEKQPVNTSNTTVSICLALGMVIINPCMAAELTLVHHGMHNMGVKKGTEIISIQAASKRAAVSNSKQARVDMISLAVPEQPRIINTFRLELAAGETLTSVALHPDDDYFLIAIKAGQPLARGHVELRSASDGTLIKRLAVGVGPDAVIIDKPGHTALIPNEAEGFVYDKATGAFTSPAGSISLIDLRNGPQQASASEVMLGDLTGTPGMVSAADGRMLERAVDWNGDGKIASEDAGLDFDNDGRIDDKAVIGTLVGEQVKVKEKKGEEAILLPLPNNNPMLLEPEYGVFTTDGKAWVTLQENNGLVLIDVARGEVITAVGLGKTQHKMDIADDGVVDFSDNRRALREPDGITITPDGRYLITADEGDTDPKAARTPAGAPLGGGRTVSVFAADSGAYLGDTANQIDEAAFAKGSYPESRSDNKGAEPEMVVSFAIAGVNYAAVGLERANALALISLAEPAHPKVIALAAINTSAKAGKIAPEGLAYYHDTGQDRHYIYTANEKNGTLSVFEVINEQRP